MMDILARLFASDFLPHGHCYQWDPSIVWLHAGSDTLIASSYYAIPLLLLYFLRKRKDIQFKQMLAMFSAFILLCGTTHLLEVWSIWNGTYRLTGVVKLATGIVSAATAVLLVGVVPRALSLPSLNRLEEVNASLREEIAARERAETALRASEERFREAFERSAIGKALVAPDGRWMQVNDALCRITGYDRRRLLELTFQDITHPDDLESDLAHVRKMILGEIRSYQIEKRYLRRDGDIAWVLLFVTAARTESDEVEYFVVEVKDITERRKWEAEQERLLADVEAERDKLQHAETQLEQMNATLTAKNRELLEFAYVASHDLREPLRKIISFADLLQDEYAGSLDPGALDLVNRMQAASMRMSDLLNDLLEYSRVTTHASGRTAVDLNDVARDVLEDLELLISETSAEVHVSELPAVSADPAQMHQLLNNLVANALKYVREGETPEIRIDSLREGAAAIVIVEDNGIGIDPKYAERVFRPFERLHGSRYGGTGMGLAICKRIVERHGGSIRVERAPVQGSRFVVRLPAAAEGEAESTSA